MSEDMIPRSDMEIILHEVIERAKPKWISVKERLPEEDALVLVHHKGLYDNFIGSVSLVRWDSTYSLICRTATHWMPLPNPPKEG